MNKRTPKRTMKRTHKRTNPEAFWNKDVNPITMWQDLKRHREITKRN
jgi:hypothetical protein